jgi:F420H2 dehydrogenase subunit M
MLPVASLLILVPLIFAVVTFFTKTKQLAAGFGLLGSLATLGLALYAYLNFDSSTAAMQFYESMKWVPFLGIKYSDGIDGITLPLILLNAIVIPFMILFTWKEDMESPNRFYGLILTMQAAVIGVFVALDFVVFYIFWELTLVPLFFILKIWAGEKRPHD